jgi:HEPN domain-containing protein
MPLDPTLVDDVKAWMRKSLNDALAAGVLIAAEPPLHEVAVYHCQQSVEKALKAFLVSHDVPFRKTHELKELGAQCLAVDASLSAIVAEVSPLSHYAWEFRYPGDPSPLEEGEAANALALARRLYDAVLERLPEECRP